MFQKIFLIIQKSFLLCLVEVVQHRPAWLLLLFVLGGNLRKVQAAM
jgi:hypothetical protein